ncbi:universal stress protein [Candidatus Sulfurimonas baltica]|uniref:Universal stress protein n=1 Tax=Candidatus Sulfurimonas baltica TaxID=2740404 RepID=A0A7S7LTB6_9BACT|nr:universal stress protein [Candidatus Sulfurimonas baltica]QOY50978.1 universal stress protein [Candidatus Sulfurimonas baltica]
MRKLHIILAAINMSILDDEVMKRAMFTAKETNAQLHFIHTIDIPLMDIEITSQYLGKKIDKDAIKKKIVHKINALNESKSVEYIVNITIGDASEQVMHMAEKIHADLIILGSHSKAKIEDYYLGSTVQKIAEESGRPILVIKNSFQGAYKNILAPTDFSSSSKKSVLFTQIAFKSSPIILIHAYKSLDDFTMEFYTLKSNNEEEYPDFLGRSYADIFKQDVGIRHIDMIKSFSSINKSLLEYVQNKQSDLIVLGSSGSDIVGSFLSSTASYLLRNTFTDVLIYIPLNQE